MSQPTGAQWRQWREDGYLMFERAIRGKELQRLQSAFDHWAAQCKPAWLERVERGETAATYYDIPSVLEKDDVFIDLVDHAPYYDCLKAFTDGDLLFIGLQARTVPPWPLSYSGWHPDVPADHPLHIKVQIYITEVGPGSGEFAYVPGSHRPEAGPYFRVRRQESMPGHRTFPGKAGDAILFNARGWHAAMDNPTRVPRKSVILIYERRTPGRGCPDAFASIAPHLTTPERRRLFGLEG